MTDNKEWDLRPKATRNRILPITLMSSEADASSEFPDKSPASQCLDFSLSFSRVKGGGSNIYWFTQEEDPVNSPLYKNLR